MALGTAAGETAEPADGSGNAGRHGCGQRFLQGRQEYDPVPDERAGGPRFRAGGADQDQAALRTEGDPRAEKRIPELPEALLFSHDHGCPVRREMVLARKKLRKLTLRKVFP